MKKLNPTASNSLPELAGLFLKLGCIGFGGPAVHIAMMQYEQLPEAKPFIYGTDQPGKI